MTKLTTLALASLCATAAAAQCTTPTGKALLLSRTEMAQRKAGMVCEPVTPLEPLAIRLRPVELVVLPVPSVEVFTRWIAPDSSRSRRGLWLALLGAGAVATVALWDRDRPPTATPPINVVPEPSSVTLLAAGVGVLALIRSRIALEEA